MRSLLRVLRVVSLGLVIGSCGDNVNGPPAEPYTGRPSFEILDGGHNNGNPHFFFLQPLAASTNATGAFDATESPSVIVCQLSASSCAPVVAQFSMTSGTGSQIIRVDATGQLYIVNWGTDQCTTGPCTLPPGNVYRIQVLVQGTELGHADVQVDQSQQQAKDLKTGDVFALVDGRTLPVKFRIEQGAVFVVGPSSQPQIIRTPITPTGSSVSLTIPANAVSQSTGLTVLPATLPAGTSVSALVGGTAYDFGPTGTTFASPVAIAVQYDPVQIPSGMAERMLRLFTLVNGVWQLVPGSRVNPGTHTVAGTTNHFSTYGVLASATVSAGFFFSCGIGTSGSAVCWGHNGIGELGNGTPGTDALVPSLVSAPPGVVFTSLSTGNLNSCGLASGVQVFCWGRNASGELGLGTTTGPQLCSGVPCSATPMPITGVGVDSFPTVSAGGMFSCAVDLLGAVFCWGDNSSAELGNGTVLSSSSPTPVSAVAGVSFVAVSASSDFLAIGPSAADSGLSIHACALTASGAAYCWGGDFSGELGSGAPPSQTCVSSIFLPPGAAVPCATAPVAVAGGIAFQSISAGPGFTCGVALSGVLYCWGDNEVGQLGNGTTTNSSTPTQVAMPAGVSVTAVTTGRDHACALSTSGSAYCWGLNFSGQLGASTTTQCLATVPCSTVPVLAGSGLNLNFTLVSAGGDHTCGIVSAPTMNTAYCWGSNGFGELGNGSLVDSPVPVVVSTIP